MHLALMLLLAPTHVAMLLSSLRLPAEKIQAAEAAAGKLVDPERCKSVLVPTLTNEIASICADIISILA